MAESKSGNCKNCRYFSLSDPKAEASAIGHCQQRELRAFALKVSGDSSCNAFEVRDEAAEPAVEPPALH